MGQIRGKKAHVSACNIRSLSLFGIPYAGMHILVSTDNSAMADGNGNFDAYVVGDGHTVAEELELLPIPKGEIALTSRDAVTGKTVFEFIYGRDIDAVLFTHTVIKATVNSKWFSIQSLAFDTQYKIRVTATDNIAKIMIQQTSAAAGGSTVATIVNNGPDVAAGSSVEYSFIRQPTAKYICVQQSNGQMVSATIDVIGKQHTEGMYGALLSDAKGENIRSILNGLEYNSNGNTLIDSYGLIVSQDILWANGASGTLAKSNFDDTVFEYTTETLTYSDSDGNSYTIIVDYSFDNFGNITNKEITIN